MDQSMVKAKQESLDKDKLNAKESLATGQSKHSSLPDPVKKAKTTDISKTMTVRES